MPMLIFLIFDTYLHYQITLLFFDDTPYNTRTGRSRLLRQSAQARNETCSLTSGTRRFDIRKRTFLPV